MTAIQSGIAKFDASETQVLAVSTDFNPSLKRFKTDLHADYPLLSDHMRKVTELYGVLIPSMGIANRVTFVIDKEGKIVSIYENKEALDPTGALTACSRLNHKKS